MSDSQKRKLGLQDLVGLVAVVVATTAAFAAVYQTQLMAKHQSISVWPYLQMWAGIAIVENDSDGLDPFSFNFANKGVGPAIIERIEIRRNGEVVPGFHSLLMNVASENDFDARLIQNSIAEANIDAGEVVEAGEVRWVIKSGNADLARILAAEVYGKRSIEVDVCYCSLYQECWQLVFPASRPQQVKTCHPVN